MEIDIVPKIWLYLERRWYGGARRYVQPFVDATVLGDLESQIAQDSPCVASIQNALLRLEAILDDPASLMAAGPAGRLLLRDALFEEDKLEKNTIDYLKRSGVSALRGWGHYSAARAHMVDRKFLDASSEFSKAEISFGTRKAAELAALMRVRASFWGYKFSQLDQSDFDRVLDAASKTIRRASFQSDLAVYKKLLLDGRIE